MLAAAHGALHETLILQLSAAGGPGRAHFTRVAAAHTPLRQMRGSAACCSLL